VLQRARLADPFGHLWEAADVQWWWRKPRPTDDLALPVWFDDVGPVAAVGLTAWTDTWQVDVFAVPATVDPEEVWTAAMEVVAEHPERTLQVLVFGDDAPVTDLAIRSGFAMTDELSGTSWMDAEARAPVTDVAGFTIVDRVDASDDPTPDDRPQRRTGRLAPSAVLALRPDARPGGRGSDGTVAGYALFWFDPVTLVGLLEPMRVEDDYYRRGLGRMLMTHGLDRLARKGARRLKVGFESDAARGLYFGGGFVQSSVDRLLIRAGRNYAAGVSTTP
jgi:GNAT superfamily N-acetyltransferase